MRLSRPLLLVVPLFLVLATGCVSENKGKLEGTRWRSEAGRVQVKSQFGEKQTVNVPEGFFELDFQADGTLFYIISGKLHAGKYSLGAGSAVTLNLEEPVSGSKTHTEKIVVTGQKMTMTDTDGTQLSFRKQ